MASRTLAGHNQILADGSESELRIKGCNAHNVSRRDADSFGDAIHNVLGKITVDILCLLENSDKIA